jgi:hypothetical protein
MSGYITLGGHSYDNVSGAKFERIKAILAESEKPTKPEPKVYDWGVTDKGKIVVKSDYADGGSWITPLISPEDFSHFLRDSTPVRILGNLKEMAEEAKGRGNSQNDGKRKKQ